MPAQRIVSNSGREATITAPRPSAATVPWAALLMLMPTVVQSPAVRPPANAFFMTTAKSGPGATVSSSTKAMNAL
jgi:hypothetical protein